LALYLYFLYHVQYCDSCFYPFFCSPALLAKDSFHWGVLSWCGREVDKVLLSQLDMFLLLVLICVRISVPCWTDRLNGLFIGLLLGTYVRKVPLIILWFAVVTDA